MSTTNIDSIIQDGLKELLDELRVGGVPAVTLLEFQNEETISIELSHETIELFLERVSCNTEVFKPEKASRESFSRPFC